MKIKDYITIGKVLGALIRVSDNVGLVDRLANSLTEESALSAVRDILRIFLSSKEEVRKYLPKTESVEAAFSNFISELEGKSSDTREIRKLVSKIAVIALSSAIDFYSGFKANNGGGEE